MRSLGLIIIALLISQSAEALCAWPWETARLRATPAVGATAYQFEYSTGVTYTNTVPEDRRPCNTSPTKVRVRGLKGTVVSEWSDYSVEFMCLGIPIDRPITAATSKGFIAAFQLGITGCEPGK